MVGTDNEVTSTDEGVIDLSSSLRDLKITTGESFVDLLLNTESFTFWRQKISTHKGKGNGAGGNTFHQKCSLFSGVVCDAIQENEI